MKPRPPDFALATGMQGTATLPGTMRQLTVEVSGRGPRSRRVNSFIPPIVLIAPVEASDVTRRVRAAGPRCAPLAVRSGTAVVEMRPRWGFWKCYDRLRLGTRRQSDLGARLHARRALRRAALSHA